MLFIKIPLYHPKLKTETPNSKLKIKIEPKKTIKERLNQFLNHLKLKPLNINLTFNDENPPHIKLHFPQIKTW